MCNNVVELEWDKNGKFYFVPLVTRGIMIIPKLPMVKIKTSFLEEAVKEAGWYGPGILMKKIREY